MSITLNEIVMRTESPLHTIRLCYERAHLMASDLFDEYFDAGINPNDRDDWWKLAHGFHNAETRSEIILDSMAHMRDALAILEGVMADIEKTAPSSSINAITEPMAAIMIATTKKEAV